MKKRYIILFSTLLLASFLCFHHSFFEWFLFLVLFGMTFLIQLREGKKKKEGIRSIFDALREGIFILDWKGQIQEVNDRGAFFLKQEKKRLKGSLFFSYQQVKQGSHLLNQIQKSLLPQKMALNGVEIELKVLEPKKKVLVTLLDSSIEYKKELLGKDFVANASHELRTPITIIKGFAETIYDLPKISDAMLNEFAEKIVRNCQRMDNLVKNLLTLADLDYLPKARLQEVDLVGLIDNCSHSLLSLYPEVEIESFHNEEIILVNGDPDLLELAIMNLLENGVKYSETSPFLTITIADFNDRVELTIADQGIGIHEEDLEKIFDRFYTVDKTHSRRLGGAGLGLSIVKVIVDKHEAALSASSVPGKGTSFTLTFQPQTLTSGVCR
ncbi:MAG: hypothetical protein KDK76_00410 [Chlamydiia bacterium]|nr:hypothetical protein [Chlamydiia bacterium]